jgi:hypothetical protein
VQNNADALALQVKANIPIDILPASGPRRYSEPYKVLAIVMAPSEGNRRLSQATRDGQPGFIAIPVSSSRLFEIMMALN